jgi:hypothetical protein
MAQTVLPFLLALLALLAAGCSDSDTKKPPPIESTGAIPTKPAASTPDLSGCTMDVGVPLDVVLNPPPPDASPEAAVFSGAWEGLWDWNNGKLPARLIVTDIRGNKVSLVYAWGTGPGAQPGYSRADDIDIQDDKIVVGSDEQRYSFAISPDGQSLATAYEARNQVQNGTMKRCGPAPRDRR